MLCVPCPNLSVANYYGRILSDCPWAAMLLGNYGRCAENHDDLAKPAFIQFDGKLLDCLDAVVQKAFAGCEVFDRIAGGHHLWKYD